MVGVVLAFAFSGIWVYAIYREDWRNPEPLWLVALAILGGAVAVPLAAWTEGRLNPDLSLLDGSLRARASVAFLVAGPVEETFKFLAVALLVWFQSHFDEPLDGIVYAAAAAAGFALVENLGFLRDAPASILVRGPAATGAHILFAAFWGGALGHAKQINRGWQRFGIVGAGLLLAYLAHGLFDLTTWSVGKELSLGAGRGIQTGLMIGCALFLIGRIRAGRRASEPAVLPETTIEPAVVPAVIIASELVSQPDDITA